MKLRNIFFFITLILIFSLIYNLNLLYPLLADDWEYSFIYGSNQTRVTNISEVFLSQYRHYFAWGGRTVVHIIAQLLLLLGTKWSNILNSIIFILYLLSIYKISDLNKKYDTHLLLFLLFIIYLLINTFISCTLWLTVSCNYLWGCLIILLFIYKYYEYYQNERYSDSIIKNIFFFIFGIISGWTNENMFLAQCFIILGIIWLLKKQNKKIPQWFIFGFIGLLIGGIFLLLAPGNYERAKYLDDLHQYTFSEKIIRQLYEAQKRYVNQILPLSLIYLLFLWYTKKYIRRTNSKKINGSLLFFFSGQIAWIFMIVSPTFPSRATFGIVSLIIIAIGILYANIKLEGKLKTFRFLLVLVLFILSLLRYYTDAQNLCTLNMEIKEREVIIEKEKLKGNRNIIFHEKITIPKRYGVEELSDDPNYWLNKGYSYFYDIDSVKLLNNRQ